MAGVSAGAAWLDVHSRLASDFGRRLSAQVQTPARRAGEEASRHFGRKFAAGLAVGGAAIGVGLWKASKAAARGLKVTTDAASALNEQVNKSNAIFGSNAKEIQKWALGAADAFGQSRSQALTNAAAFGDMFLQLKLGRAPATAMSKRMVELASDLASFSDADITQVLEAQQSAFRGEYDALQRFIPNINAARVEQEALRLSHKRSAKDLTAAEKAQAAYNIIVRDSARAHGDYARTLRTSVANQNRKAQAQWENLKVTLGNGFLPAQLAVTRAFTEKLLPAAKIFVRELAPGVGKTASALATALAGAVPPAGELADTARNLGDRLGDLAPKVGPLVERLVDGFRDLGPSLQQVGGGGRIFANTLTIMGPVLDVVARNIHNLVPWLPVILTGFLAFRAIKGVAQPFVALGEVISNLTAPFRIVALYGQKRALQAHTTALVENTAAMRGNAVSEQLSTAAKNGGILASVRARVATIAQAVAQRAVAAASKAWAAVQWLLNAALTANPIGLVIAAVALLVAGIVLAYRNSETFRRIVKGAFNAVKGVVAGVVSFILDRFRDWWNLATTVVAGILRLFGKLPGPLGAPFRKAEEAVRKAKETVNTQLDKIQQRVDRLRGKDIPITATLRTFRTPGGAIAMQHGGILREPVIGVGVRTGSSYTLGEAGPEAVTPLSRSVGAVARSGELRVLPLSRLAGIFRDVLRSWVVPWLRRIALGIERHGVGAVRLRPRPRRAQGASRGTHGPRTTAWWPPRSGNRASYDAGGTLPENVLGVGPSGRSYSFQGGERVTPAGGEAMTVTLDGPSRRALVRELADTLRAIPPEVYMDRQRVAAAVAGGAISNRRR